MKQMKIYDIGLKDANVKMQKQTGNVIKSNKCNQCDYASSRPSDLRTHLKIHSGESQTDATSVTLPVLIQAL